jgi:exopolysaccharide biosynthesis polyprenyl glycosylphosphotransferase
LKAGKNTGGVVVLTDILLINLAFWLSYMVRYRLGFPYPVPPFYDAPYLPYLPYALLLTALCLLSFQIDGLYEPQRGRGWLYDGYRLASGTATSIVIVMAITFFFQPLVYSRGMLVLAATMIIIFLSMARVLNRALLIRRRRRGIGVDRVLVVGAGDIGRSVIQSILANPAVGYQVVGYIDDDPLKGNGKLGRIRGLGNLEDLPNVIATEGIDEVIVTLPWMYHRKILHIVEECERGNVPVRVVPDVFQQRMGRVDLDTLSGIPLIGTAPVRLSQGAFLVKRVIDLSLSILAIPFMLILFAVVALFIKLDSPGPVIFKQRRVGKDGRPFHVLKFRSMVVGAEQMQADLEALNEADGPLFKVRHDPRVTRVGRWLRRTSIDELPQLINVIRGEMSLVGPRPGTPEEVAQYESWQMQRISVLPGITGLWQVSGRSDVPFEEMVLLDIFYIENWSLDLEIRILLQTIPYVLLGHGAY